MSCGDLNDKNLAMICVTVLAGACLGVELYGISVSMATSSVISQVVTGLMGAAVGRAMVESK